MTSMAIVAFKIGIFYAKQTNHIDVHVSCLLGPAALCMFI